MSNQTMNLKDALRLADNLIKEKSYTKAKALLNEILSQAPENGSVYFLMGLLHYETEQIETAVNYLEQSIRRFADNQNAYLILFNCYSKLRRTQEAVQAIEKALSFKTDEENCNYHIQYLAFCYHNKLYQKGKTHGKKLLASLKPNKYIYNLLGLLYRDTGDFITAVKYFSQAVKLDPDFLEAMHNVVFIYQQTHQNDEAIVILKKCLKINPDFIAAYIDLANVYIVKKQLNNAMTTIQKAYEIAPLNEEVIATYMYAARYAIAWDDIKMLTPHLNTCIEKNLKNGHLVPERPWLNITRTQNQVQNFNVAVNTVKHYIKPKVDALHTNFNFKKTYPKKINLGFLTNDFYNHATTQLLGHLFDLIDKSIFKITALSYAANFPEDYYQQSIRTEADKYVDLELTGYDSIAKQIYHENIDILLDMKGYTGGALMEVAMLKPAPLLVQYLGYPGTMGASQYDYIVTDKITTPLKHEKYYTEKFAYMPNTYQVTDNTQKISSTHFSRSDFGLPEDKIILAVFNNSFKVEETCFKIWLDILKENKNAILWFYESNDFIKLQLINYAKNYNHTAHQIVFTEKFNKPEHLARIQLADLMLDTFTCNGHTTTTDGLWAGIPVITLQGQHFCSRVSSSILHAIELPELITYDQADYKKCINDYCQHPDKINALKNKIKDKKTSAPLFNSAQYAKDFGALMSKIYERYSNGLAPAHIEL